jgi:hypothetical protein
MALYKYWKKFFPFPTTIITNTAIGHKYFYYKDYIDSIEKPSQFMHNATMYFDKQENRIVTLQCSNSLVQSLYLMLTGSLKTARMRRTVRLLYMFL